MEENKKIPFPQADDMSKIFKIVNVQNETCLNDKTRMCVILGDISERQVQYYLNAAEYLGIITQDKEFSEFGKELRNKNSFEQRIMIAQKIVSKEVFGEVYFTEVILGVKLERDEIVLLMKKRLIFNSDAMYYRRAQTVLKWIEWINNNDERIQK